MHVEVNTLKQKDTKFAEIPDVSHWEYPRLLINSLRHSLVALRAPWGWPSHDGAVLYRLSPQLGEDPPCWGPGVMWSSGGGNWGGSVGSALDSIPMCCRLELTTTLCQGHGWSLSKGGSRLSLWPVPTSYARGPVRGHDVPPEAFEKKWTWTVNLICPCSSHKLYLCV